MCICTNLWKKCLSWMFYCWGERSYIGVGSKQIACHVLELLQVQGKTSSSAKTVTLPMKLNQLPWKMNLWKRNISVTSNQLVRELACDWNNRQINKHTWARNLFFNTTSANIWHGNSLLCCLSPDVFTSNKALVNLAILFWFSCPGTLVLSACFMHFWIWHWWEGSGKKLNFDGLTDFDL